MGVSEQSSGENKFINDFVSLEVTVARIPHLTVYLFMADINVFNQL